MKHCGSCSNACAFPHVQGLAFASGKCGFTKCEDGWGNFDQNLSNGCEGLNGGNCNNGNHTCKKPNGPG